LQNVAIGREQIHFRPESQFEADIQPNWSVFERVHWFAVLLLAVQSHAILQSAKDALSGEFLTNS
jgi:hypothetical protein